MLQKIISFIKTKGFIVNAAIFGTAILSVLTIPVLIENSRASTAPYETEEQQEETLGNGAEVVGEILGDENGETKTRLKAEHVDFFGSKFWLITVVDDDKEVTAWLDIKDEVEIEIIQGDSFYGTFEKQIVGIAVLPDEYGAIGVYTAKINYSGLTVEISNQRRAA